MFPSYCGKALVNPWENMKKLWKHLPRAHHSNAFLVPDLLTFYSINSCFYYDSNMKDRLVAEVTITIKLMFLGVNLYVFGPTQAKIHELWEGPKTYF